MIARLSKYILKRLRWEPEMNPRRAYDLWANSYDEQSKNLILHLEGNLFTELTGDIRLENKSVLDFGCGTGRHWKEVWRRNPSRLVGYDVSKGMLQQLSLRFPDAEVHHIRNIATQIHPDNSFDVLICTLVLGHVRRVESTFREWNRLLKPNGDIVLTDYHPSATKHGGKRSFSFNGKSISIRNHVHTVHETLQIAKKLGWTVCNQVEVSIDETARSFFKNLEAFEATRGMHIIYGLHLKKTQC